MAVLGLGLGLIALVALVAFIGSRARSSESPASTRISDFATGESVVVGTGYRLYPSLEAYRSFAPCEASRDYDNQKVAARYSRDAESFGEVTRAAQAKAYADKQAALVCEADGRLTKEDTPATVTRVEKVTIRYEGLMPKIAAAKPKVVAITRDDTVYVVNVNGRELVVSQDSLRRKEKKQ